MSEYTELVERAEFAATSAKNSAAQTKSDKDTVVSLYNEIKAIIDAGGGGGSCKFYECTAVDNGKDIPAIPAVKAGIVVTGFSDSSYQAMNGHYSLVGEFATMKTAVWKHDTADYYIGYSEEYSYWCLSYGQSFTPWDAYKYVSSDGTKAPWEYDWSTADGNAYGEAIKLTGSFEDKPEIPAIPGTGVKSWAGYEWLWDDEVGYTKASDITTGLSWTINMPEVGNTYTEDGLVRIQLMYNTETATPLTFTAEQATSTVKLAKSGTVDTSGIQYRYSDDDAWQDYSIGTNITLVNVGDTVQFKNSKNQLSKDGDNYINVQATGKIAASGNIQSMLNYEDVCGDGAFAKFFEGCTVLTQAPNLPAKSVGAHCYSQMFNGCSSLKAMPVISATKFTGEHSCQRMFGDCTSLTKVTPINAIEVGQYCYSYMFSGCSALETPPALNTTKFDKYSCECMFENCSSLKETPHFAEAVLAEYCYQYMFKNCSSLTTAHKLPSLVLSDYCYSYMFSSCNALTTAPELSATTLAKYCYQYMFNGCSSLTTAPVLPATTLAEYCYYYMFYNCGSLTTAPSTLPATTLVKYCYYGMFHSCTSLTQAPELPATTLADRCYKEMFYGCTSLTTAPELPATTLASHCYSNMFCSCSSLTKTPELPAETLVDSCYYRMFYYCNQLNSVKVNFTSWNESNHYNWLDGVSSSGTFYKQDELPAEFGPSKIPEGWTVKSINESEEPDTPTPDEPEQPEEPEASFGTYLQISGSAAENEGLAGIYKLNESTVTDIDKEWININDDTKKVIGYWEEVDPATYWYVKGGSDNYSYDNWGESSMSYPWNADNSSFVWYYHAEPVSDFHVTPYVSDEEDPSTGGDNGSDGGSSSAGDVLVVSGSYQSDENGNYSPGAADGEYTLKDPSATGTARVWVNSNGTFELRAETSGGPEYSLWGLYNTSGMYDHYTYWIDNGHNEPINSDGSSVVWRLPGVPCSNMKVVKK